MRASSTAVGLRASWSGPRFSTTCCKCGANWRMRCAASALTFDIERKSATLSPPAGGMPICDDAAPGCHMAAIAAMAAAGPKAPDTLPRSLLLLSSLLEELPSFSFLRFFSAGGGAGCCIMPIMAGCIMGGMPGIMPCIMAICMAGFIMPCIIAICCAIKALLAFSLSFSRPRDEPRPFSRRRPAPRSSPRPPCLLEPRRRCRLSGGGGGGGKSRDLDRDGGLRPGDSESSGGPAERPRSGSGDQEPARGGGDSSARESSRRSYPGDGLYATAPRRGGGP
mmetsp:Transcript_33724/g.90317  ORF Transcript_33724/g.90317 Transcript_33724/m.90317 type:complete len:280 (+) Transcript_33724:396-1235(+)